MVLLLVTSVVFDCLHKEGLILHLCFVVIPVVLPAAALAHWALSLGWVFVCFPVGIVLGLLFYTFLDAIRLSLGPPWEKEHRGALPCDQRGQGPWLAWNVLSIGQFQFFDPKG